MPLIIPPAPAAAERSLRAALTTPAALRSPHPLNVDPSALRPALSLPVHRLAPLTGPAGPRAARLTGWRFLLALEGRPAGAGETVLTPDGWAFSHFSGGPYTASTQRAMALAEALPAPYQAALLSVPDLYMLTLWLRADPAGDPASGAPLPEDLLVPLAPAPPGIAAHVPARADLLLAQLAGRLAPLELAS